MNIVNLEENVTYNTLRFLAVDNQSGMGPDNMLFWRCLSFQTTKVINYNTRLMRLNYLKMVISVGRSSNQAFYMTTNCETHNN